MAMGEKNPIDECKACELIKDDICKQVREGTDLRTCEELFERMINKDPALTKEEVRRTLNSLKPGLYEDFRRRVLGVLRGTGVMKK